MNKLLAILIFTFIFQLIPISRVYANLDDSIFVIKATWPENGQTNVPVDLKSGLTGSSYSDPPGIGNIAISYGTDVSGGCGEPPDCPNIPDIKNDSINSSTIAISSPNDPNISIKFSGRQDGNGSFHNFSIIPVNSAIPNGIKLMPNTTYTVTLKGNSSGIKANRSIVNGNKEVSLPSDYSWTFTTGEGSIPSREAPATPQPTASTTSAPTSTTTSSSNELINSIPTPTSTPTPKIITQATPKPSSTAKLTANNKTILGIATPSASATFSGQISSSESAQPKTQKVGFFNSVINFVLGLLKNIFRF